jgi:hypothetical protein
MADLHSVLSENVGFYLDLERRLKARLVKLPKGSVLKRKIRGRDYFYLKVRDGSRVLSKYLGRKEPAELKEAIAERRLLSQQLREAKANLRLLARLRRPRRGRSV